MLSVWKFPLAIYDTQTIHLPKGFEILTIQVQNGTPVLWALVDTERPTDSVKLITKGTGDQIRFREVGKYLGTYQIQGLVFHVFYSWVPE